LVLGCLAGACGRDIGHAGTGTLDGWNVLEPGLELGVFHSPVRPETGDGRIRVLRIEPGLFDLRLLNASASDTGRPLSVREWSERHDLVAAINASMYQQDLVTSVSMMRTQEHVNNPHLTRHRAILAFDRKQDDVVAVRIIDLECDDLDEWRSKYGTLVQSIRMLSCKGENVWEQQPERWSTAAIGIDERDRVLFIHVKSPFTVHDLIDILVGLPLGLTALMYAEGGSEAQLFVRSGGADYEFVGGRETGFGDPGRGWPVPNVIGVVRRQAPPR
jgi:hypothetical protein